MENEGKMTMMIILIIKMIMDVVVVVVVVLVGMIKTMMMMMISLGDCWSTTEVVARYRMKQWQLCCPLLVRTSSDALHLHHWRKYNAAMRSKRKSKQRFGNDQLRSQ